MNDEQKDNYSTRSNDYIQIRKRKLEIKSDEDDSNLNEKRHKMQDSKTLPNFDFNIIDDSETNEINAKKEGFSKLDYKKKYNTINSYENEHNNKYKNIGLKKIEKKVNRNLKLLKIVKERMKEQKYKSMLEEEKPKKEDLNNEEIKREKSISNKNEEEKEKDIKKKEPKNKDEEKKNKLLNIINSKKYNKFQRKDNEKKEKEKEKIKGKESKINDKENPENKDKNINKSNEIGENKNKLTTNNRAKTVFNNKKNNKNLNEKDTSKKGALKILELLKMRKKEENNNNTNSFRSDENDLKNIIEMKPNDNTKNKNIDSYAFRPKNRVLGKVKRDKNFGNTLPKDDYIYENEDNKYDNQNIEQKFDNSQKINNNKVQKNNEPNNKILNYFNLNNANISQNSLNNKPINNTNLKKYQNNNINNRVTYKNPISIKNKFKERLQNFNTINNEFVPINKNRINNFEEVNNQLKTLDNSFDTRKIKKPIMKKILNKTSINQKIYKPKKISNNNSPQKVKLNEYERNTINTEYMAHDNIKNIFHNKNVFNNTKNKKGPMAYIKKSPNKFGQLNTSIANKTVETEQNVFKRKTKKLVKDKKFFNTSYNSVGISPKIPDKSVIQPKSFMESSNNFYLGYQSNNPKENYYNNIANNNVNRIRNTTNNILQKPQKKSIIFNIEDLIILEERLNDVILALETNDNIENKCFNFWNYYFNCSLYNLLEKIFKNKEDSNIIRLSINYLLMSIMVCYEYSFEIDPTEEEIYLFLLELLDLNHNNLIIICEYILTKIFPENKQNIWVLKLQQIIKNTKLSEKNQFLQKNNPKTSIEKISLNINLIIKSLKNILLNFPTEYSDLLISLLKQIDTKTYEEINDFFREYILRVDNFEGSIIASSYLKKNKKFKPLPAPYLTSPPSKPYTLILDLDETLVHFQIKSSKGGTLRARPYLFGFLEEMGHYYELVIWTSATEAYANSLIDAIEYEKKYFDYVLYREHAIIIGDDFVKDLTRIGRGLDRIIIIDDMPQNFRLQKENGITIKPFFGDDLDDSALYELVPILKHIAEEGDDVRTGLDIYREEIVKRITSNISKQKIK